MKKTKGAAQLFWKGKFLNIAHKIKISKVGSSTEYKWSNIITNSENNDHMITYKSKEICDYVRLAKALNENENNRETYKNI